MTPHNSSYRNNSSLNFKPMQQFVEPEPLRWLRLSMFAVIVLGSLVGNTVLIRAVVRAKRVKSITYILICYLALGEIISSCCLPFVQSYEELKSWPFPDAMCHLVNPLQIMAGMEVTSCIASIAVVRCLSVNSIQLYRMARYNLLAILLGLIIWFTAFTLVLPYFLYMTKVPSMANDGTFWCLLLLPGDKLDESYPSIRQRRLIIVILIINYVIPLAITLICYSVVISKFRLHRQVAVAHNIEFHDDEVEQTEAIEMESASRVEANAQQNEPGNCSTSPTPRPKSVKPDVVVRRRRLLSQANAVEARDDELNEYESDLLRMFYAIVLIFVLCYLPYQCFFMLEYNGNLSWKNWKYFDVTRRYLFLLTCCPSALHPICYGLMSRFYRKAFYKLILCR